NYSDRVHYETHSGDYSGCFAGSAYDVFANTFFLYDGNIYDMVIDDAVELEILLRYLTDSKGRDMGRGTYVKVDLRCDNTLLKEYISKLKSNNVDIFADYSVDTKYTQAYGSMTSLVFTKK
ncbi:MAG: hypothetical protein K2I23_00760, partial [Clostridia bacterium]|nr:hypothetical protein [Clostridia bacterium]